jgi:hypothetical protein
LVNPFPEASQVIGVHAVPTCEIDPDDGTERLSTALVVYTATQLYFGDPVYPLLQVNDWLEAINTLVPSEVVFHEVGIAQVILAQLLTDGVSKLLTDEQVNDAVNKLL